MPKTTKKKVKVRITMEAEIGDLDCYWPNDPKGITLQNVWDTLRRAHLQVLENGCDIYTPYADGTKKNPAVVAALRAHYEKERTLCERIFDQPGGFKLEIIEEE